MADNNLKTKLRLTISLLGLLAAGCASTPPPADQQATMTAEGRAGSATETPHFTSPPHSAEASQPAYEDLWDRLRDGFSLPELNSPRVDYYVKWYADRPEYMARITKRASMYLYHIVEELERHDFPMEIALLPAVESAFKPRAYSHAHASGLWQFISATGRRYGLKQNWWYDGRRDVIGATDAAIQYLAALRDEFEGDWFHALASYNGGEGRVRRAIKQNRAQGKPAGYPHLNLRRETMHYVPKLMAVKRIVADPGKYGLTLAPIPNQPYFAIIDVGAQIDLSIVAEAANISTDLLRDLNPGFRRWATDPSGPHRILVPVDARRRVADTLASLPSDQRMRWARHQIRHGDTLSQIARRYGISVAALRTSNRLHGSLIRAGDTLLVPLSSASIASTGGSDSGQPVVHRVRRGDTLWAIARRYQVLIRQLQRWNHIAANDTLRPGQEIRVYVN